MEKSKVIPEPKATELIDEIMDNFNFGDVVKMMKSTKWTWFGIGVPEESDVRLEARRLLRKIANSNDDYISAGGFTVERFGDDFLKLSFGIEWIAGGDK